MPRWRIWEAETQDLRGDRIRNGVDGLGFGFRTEALVKGGLRLFLDLWSSIVVICGRWSPESRRSHCTPTL